MQHRCQFLGKFGVSDRIGSHRIHRARPLVRWQSQSELFRQCLRERSKTSTGGPVPGARQFRGEREAPSGGNAPPCLARMIPNRSIATRAQTRSLATTLFPSREPIWLENRPGRAGFGKLLIATIAIIANGGSGDESSRRAAKFAQCSDQIMRRGDAAVAQNRLRAAVQRPPTMEAPARCTTASAPSALESRVLLSGSQTIAFSPGREADFGCSEVRGRAH